MTVRGQRSWIRKWLRRAGVAVAVFLLLVLAAGVALHLFGRLRFARAVAELEALVGEEVVFDFAHLETPTLPRSENAAELLLPGAETLDWPDGARDLLKQAWLLPRREWDPELERRVGALCEHNHAGLEALHRAAGIERSSYGIRYGDGVAALIPDLLPFIPAAKLLSVEGRLALADGDVDGGLAAARALARIARSLDQEHYLITALIEAVVERSLNRLVFDVLQETEPWATSPGFLTELEAVVPSGDWLAKTQEAVLLEGSITSVSCRRIPPWPIRALFGHLVAAEILIATRKSVALIPVPYGSAQERFHAAYRDDATSLFKVYHHEYLGHLYPSRSPEPTWGQRAILVPLRALILMLGAVPHSTAVDASANSWGLLAGDLHKFHLFASQRQLLRAAMALRQAGIAGGSYPRQRPDVAALAEPDPLTGRLIAYLPDDDGSLRLELEGAAKLVAERWLRPLPGAGKPPDWIKKDLRERLISVTLPPPALVPLPSSGATRGTMPSDSANRHETAEQEAQNLFNPFTDGRWLSSAEEAALRRLSVAPEDVRKAFFDLVTAPP